MIKADNEPRLWPWLSVWSSPRETITQILAGNPTHGVLLLASLATIAGFLARLAETTWAAALLDWRVILAVAIAGTIFGIVLLYVQGFLYAVVGRWLGGQASPRQMRAIVAWGSAPYVLLLGFMLAALLSLKLIGAGGGRGFSTVLQWVALAAGLWSLVLTLLMLSRAQSFGFWRTILNGGIAALILFLLAVLIRAFLFEPFSVASSSMAPTLQAGDRLFVSKPSYGYSRFSLPFSPDLFQGRIFGRQPQRGDVVAFHHPKDTGAVYIMRLVGLPGDRIRMVNGVLHINGEAVRRERMEDHVQTDRMMQTTRAKRWRETLPNGVSYDTLDLVDNGFYDNTQEYVVPAGHYFMMGDNRDNSSDSRVLSQVGYIPFDNLIGPAQVIFFSLNPDRPQPHIDFGRIGLVR